MRRPIPGGKKRNEDKRKDQSQLGQWVETVEGAVTFDVKGKSLVHGVIINDKKETRLST
jgi:hypothetical protein